jgi:hypothetical protein
MGHGYFLSGLTWLKGSKVYVVTKKEGLFSDRIGSIGFDSKDRIWVIDTGGRTGVYSFDYLQNIGRKFSQKPVRVNKKKLLQ